MASKGKRIEIYINDDYLPFRGRASKAFFRLLEYGIANNFWTNPVDFRWIVCGKYEIVFNEETNSVNGTNQLIELALMDNWFSLLQLSIFLFCTDFPRGTSITETRKNLLEIADYCIRIGLNKVPKTNLDKEIQVTSHCNSSRVI